MVRRTAAPLAAALIVLAFLSAPASATGGSAGSAETSALSLDQDYWYFDIYKPFFTEGDGPDGFKVVTASRPRARNMAFPKNKSSGTIRVFVVGGSVAALYDADESPVRPRLAEILSGLFRGRKVEVVNCGMGAYDSYRESLLLTELAAYAPDIIILLSGNNELMTASGPPALTGLASLKLARLLKTSPKASPPESAGGGRRSGADAMKAFEARLRSMIAAARSAGAVVVACTLPRLLGRPPKAPLPFWDATFREAWAELEAGRHEAAAGLLRRYVESSPGDPMGRVFLGRALERLGDAEGARQSYLSGQGLDPASDPNPVIRRVAREEGAVLADLHVVFNTAAAAPSNERLMVDDVHWERTSDPLVSAVIARALGREGRRQLPAALSGGMDPDWVVRGVPAWEKMAREGLPRSEEDFRSRALRAIWESLLEVPGISEAAVAGFESLLKDYPKELALFETSRAGLEARVRTSVWMRARSAEFDRRWTAALTCIGESYRRAGLLLLARKYFGAALDLSPGDPWPRLGMALAAAGEPGRAVAELAKIREPEASLSTVRHYRAFLDPAGKTRPSGRPALGAAGGLTGTAQFWSDEARSSLEFGDEGVAAVFLDRALAAGPGPGEMAILAESFSRLRDREGLRRVLRLATRASGKASDPELAVRLAGVALDAGEDSLARGLLRGPALRPDDPRALVARARLELRSGRRGSAKTLLSRAESLQKDARSLRCLASAWDEAGEPDRVRLTLERLVGLAPRDPDALLELAAASLAAGRREEARERLGQAEALSLSGPDLRRAARIRRELGDHKQSLADLERLGAATDADRHSLGLALSANGDYTRCVEILTGLVEKHPDSPVYLSDRAVCAFGLRSVEPAIRDLTRAIELDPAFLPAYASLAAIHTGREEYREALRVCKAALRRGTRSEHRKLREEVQRLADDLAQRH
ncbi:MAG: tetratricopeptide repeat protein [Elusimicrobiota bacterium]|jgi:Flp pilus assembly protein TadD